MASITYEYDCDLSSGVLPDPHSPKRVGYLTDLGGLGLAAPLAKDVTCWVPYSGTPTYTPLGLTPAPVSGGLGKVTVAGVLGRFEWTPPSAIKFTFYTSQSNAAALRSAALRFPTTGTPPPVSALGWWITNYDPLTKRWFEQCFPVSPLRPGGRLAAAGSSDDTLDVSPQPVAVKDGIEAYLYKIVLNVLPVAAHPTLVTVATSSTSKQVRTWGT